MNIRNFLTSKTFFKHLASAIGISLVGVFFVLTSLKLYTRHGESIVVPDLTGLTEFEFERLLEKSDLEYSITDSTYIEGMVAGSVVDQVPDAGHKVKRHRTLFLTINAIAPEQVIVPRLTDISLRQSLSQLESAGLLPGDITYKPSEYRNLILQATIGGRDLQAGETVPKGSKIDLIVGSGESMDLVFLPNLTGLTLQTARLIVAESMLTMGAIIYDNTVISHYDSLNARVWRQHPDYRSVLNVNTGSSVDLWVSMDENKFIQDIDNEIEPQEELDF
jgi:eukaryotic-like serine/threonine-protein kinase